MNTQPQQAISVEGLTRRFAVRQRDRIDRRVVRRELTAVDAITLRIPRGELFVLLGPNGAGKTTTIRMLCTLLPPTEGSARVWDFDVVRQPGQVRRRIGVLLTGERSVYWRLTGRENLTYLRLPPRCQNDARQPQLRRNHPKRNVSGQHEETPHQAQHFASRAGFRDF